MYWNKMNLMEWETNMTQIKQWVTTWARIKLENSEILSEIATVKKAKIVWTAEADSRSIKYDF